MTESSRLPHPNCSPATGGGATTPKPSCSNLEAPLYLVYTHFPIFLHLTLRRQQPQHYNLTRPPSIITFTSRPHCHHFHFTTHNFIHLLTIPITSLHQTTPSPHVTTTPKITPSPLKYTPLTTLTLHEDENRLGLPVTPRVVNCLMLVSRF